MDLGDTLRFSSDVFDNDGVLANAQSVSLTITLPDGTTVTPTVTNPPSVTGKYFYDYGLTVNSPAGRYYGKWLFTFAGGATTSYEEEKDARASLVTVGSALQHLRAAGVITSEPDLETLQLLTFMATDAVERHLDLVIARRSITSTFDGGRRELRLRRPPRPEDGGAITITSVVEDGATVSDSVVRRQGWKLLRNAQGQWWSAGYENVTVTYTAGCFNPPYVARKVCLNTVQGMWQVSQQAPHPALSDFADEVVGVAAAALTAPEQAGYESLRYPLMS